MTSQTMNGTNGTSNGTNGTSASKQQPNSIKATIPSRVYSISEPPSLDAFASLCAQSPLDYPLATSVHSNIPIYTLPPFSTLSTDQRSALQDEWHHILLSGPGVFVTKNMYTDQALIERVNSVYSSIIADEKRASNAKGDHFGHGQNDRIWNSFSKHCLKDPATFLQYYSNPYLQLIASAWLGPNSRLTAQVNIVKPGGAPQICHRDYHLGFQDAATCAGYPKALQIASQFLTLQGAVAHSDMPLESGPTRLLPFSQLFEEGYMAYRLPEFRQFFLDHYVSLALEQGDGLFFNPALFHAAGENTSKDIQRSANLLQISSAFGKPMETIDSYPLVESCWDGLVRMYKERGMNEEVKAFVAAVAEGYPFPTNLDRRVPQASGMAPSSEQDALLNALEAGTSKERLLQELRLMRSDSTA